MQEPKLEKGQAIVTCCPICKSPFEEPALTNDTFTCPNCDSVVLVRVFVE
jgi:hypothetical protein